MAPEWPRFRRMLIRRRYFDRDAGKRVEPTELLTSYLPIVVFVVAVRDHFLGSAAAIRGGGGLVFGWLVWLVRRK